MSFLLFFIIHILIGMALLYFHGRLPKALSTFFIVFFTMSVLCWGSVLLGSIQL